MAKRFRFEWDRENKILLTRFLEKRLIDESLAEVYAALREYAIATEPYAAIIDFSAAIQVDLSADFIRHRHVARLCRQRLQWTKIESVDFLRSHVAREQHKEPSGATPTQDAPI